MEIENYEITPEGEIITFRRQHIQESGKENCCYALWQDNRTKHLVFGLLNSAKTYGVGISVNDHHNLIINHIQKIINSKSVFVMYRYIPAPPESYGNGVVCEIIPKEVKTEREVSDDVISQFKQILHILNEYKECI